MKIEKRGIRITELPAGVEIETSEGRIEVKNMGGFESLILTVNHAAQIRAALTEALKSLGASVEANPEGPWASLDDIPQFVRQVKDKDGDLIKREPDGSWPVRAGEWDHYAPFRRA